VAALEVVLRPALQLGRDSGQDHGPPPALEAHMRPACSTNGKRHRFVTGPS
jgi:hypothetical protein